MVNLCHILAVRRAIRRSRRDVETLESSEWSAPGRAEEGTWLSGERRHGTGKAKTASPRPLLTATPTFPVPRAAGEGPARHWEGAFRSVEGKDGAVAVRRRHGQAVRGTRRHPSRFADSQKGVPAKTAPHVWKHHRDVRMMWHGASM